ncbi:MAG: hypothetical protein ACRD2W_17345 [Acidimicrobiales bacterium]
MPDSSSANRVVLGRRQPKSMTPFVWSGNEPDGLDLETAEELGAVWEGDELVIYDLPGFKELLEYYESGDYTIDND